MFVANVCSTNSSVKNKEKTKTKQHNCWILTKKQRFFNKNNQKINTPKEIPDHPTCFIIPTNILQSSPQFFPCSNNKTYTSFFITFFSLYLCNNRRYKPPSQIDSETAVCSKNIFQSAPQTHIKRNVLSLFVLQNFVNRCMVFPFPIDFLLLKW